MSNIRWIRSSAEDARSSIDGHSTPYCAHGGVRALERSQVTVAAAFLALEGDMRIYDMGIEALRELYVAVRDAGGHRPVVIDSDDLVARPEATMRAYCAAVDLPYLADAMSWKAGVRPEWQRTARWHEDASASTGFFQPIRRDRYSLESHSEVLRFASRHRPFYERLRSNRIRIDAAVDATE